MARTPTVAPLPRHCPKHPGPPKSSHYAESSHAARTVPKRQDLSSPLPKGTLLSLQGYQWEETEGTGSLRPQKWGLSHILPAPPVLKT